MKLDISISGILQAITKIFKRLVLYLYVLALIGATIGAAVYFDYVAKSSPKSDSTSGTTSTFDTTSINLLQSLHSYDQNTAYSQLPSGRTNPFFE